MIELHNVDCLELMPTLKRGSIDVICIDPPYLYLKNQKLERPFDERLFFSECKRLLTKDGFIILFGRGASFYRWNTMLDDLGFTFKEEVIWDKNYNSSAVHPLSRTHETIAIWGAGLKEINRVKIPYIESKQHNVDKIIGDVKRLRCVLSKSKELEHVEEFLETFKVPVVGGKKEATTTLQKGVNKTSVTASVMQMIELGMNEKSVIKVEHDRYTRIHPTQKPVRLLERLIQLVLPKKPLNEITIADFFGGSFSTMEAAHKLGCNGISCEIDKEYFDLGKGRIDKLTEGKLF